MRLFFLIICLGLPAAASAQSYGKFCGQSAKSGDVAAPPNSKPRDQLDAVCKYHDACSYCGTALRGKPKLVRAPLKTYKGVRLNKKGKLKAGRAKTKQTMATQTPEACRQDFKDALRRMKRKYCRSKKFNAKRCGIVLSAQSYADTVKGYKATPAMETCVNMLRKRFKKAEWKGRGTLECNKATGRCKFVD